MTCWVLLIVQFLCVFSTYMRVKRFEIIFLLVHLV